MKVVKIIFDMPYHPYGQPDTEEKRAADIARLHIDMQDRGITVRPDFPIEVFADSDKAISIFCEYSKRDHTNIRVSGMEEIFNGQNQTVEDMHNVLSRLQVAAAKVEAQQIAGTHIDGMPGYHAGQPGWNNHAAAPIPGPLMASFNDLNLVEDACTDQIQHLLNEGWRIVAVCPQESRRPDYVLGRCVAERIYRNTGARRGED